MLDASVKKYKIKYVLISDMNSQLRSESKNTLDMSQDISSMCGATISLVDENGNSQAIFISDSCPSKSLLFKIFGFDSSRTSWHSFCRRAMGREIDTVVLNGIIQESDALSDYIIALTQDNTYEYVLEHHIMVSNSPIKRPLASISTGRSMLEVCTEDLGYSEEQVNDAVNKAIYDRNNSFRLKKNV